MTKQADAKSSQDLARALSLLVARAPELKPDEVISCLDEIEATSLPKVASSKKNQLETRRRVAEWKFKLLSERDLPFNRIERLHREIHDLGFTNLETEGTIEIYFAQYCARQSRYDDAKRVLERLRTRLSKALAKRKLRIYSQLEEEVEGLLSGLRSTK